MVHPLADGRRVHWRITDRHVGDLAVTGDPSHLEPRRSGIVAQPWTWLTQVHGARVVEVTRPGEHAAAEADAAVTATSDAPLAVHTADCAPVLVIADGGAVAVVHAGWRGLLDGVLEAAVGRLAGLAAGPFTAVLGPCIHAGCYEFTGPELDVIAERYGASVRGVTGAGTPALDLPAAVGAALRASQVPLDTTWSGCTGCDPRWYSHRVRGEAGRQALVAWIEEPAPGQLATGDAT